MDKNEPEWAYQDCVVCMCSFVCARVACANVSIGCRHQLLPTFFLRQGCSLKLERNVSAMVAGQQAPGISVSASTVLG